MLSEPGPPEGCLLAGHVPGVPSCVRVRWVVLECVAEHQSSGSSCPSLRALGFVCEWKGALWFSQLSPPQLECGAPREHLGQGQHALPLASFGSHESQASNPIRPAFCLRTFPRSVWRCSQAVICLRSFVVARCARGCPWHPGSRTLVSLAGYRSGYDLRRREAEASR